MMTGTMEREVSFIAANPKFLVEKTKQLRVAAYCRVSTESEEQASSYEIQQAYYKEKISDNKDWELVGIYAEEVSGTRAEKRGEFMKMINKCKRKKIDLIITKSISRFARNTVDCLKYIRELKALGIGIIFEKENINTLDYKSEVIMTILSSLAQEEINSHSGNVKMGRRMKAKEGQVAFVKVYGYEVNGDKTVTVNKEQAEVVQYIFDSYLKGSSFKQIQIKLASKGWLSPSGKETWSPSTIQNILSNEKYRGDIITQKTITTDPISKKVVKNNGELPKVLVKYNHTPIVTREIYGKVQLEIARRNSKKKVSITSKTELAKYSSKYALTEILVCDECNTAYRRTTWTAGKSKKIVWRCVSRLDNGKKFCKKSPTLLEEELHQAILEALNETKETRESLIDFMLEKIELGCARHENRDGEMLELERQIAELKKATMELVMLSASGTEDYTDRMKELNLQTKLLTETLVEVKKTVGDNGGVAENLMRAKEILQQMTTTLKEYDDVKTRQCIAQIRVVDKEKIKIIFKDGYEYEKRLS